MISNEKYLNCPKCGEGGKRWLHDAQHCESCGYSGIKAAFKPMTRIARTPADGPEPVAVKKLVWTETGFAHTSVGMMYRIQKDASGIFVLSKYEGSSEIKSARATEDGAKEEAQADYEARIRSALSQPALPTVPCAGKAEALVATDQHAVANEASAAPPASEVPDTGGLVERYNSLIETALSYAADEKPAHEKFLPSVFELQVGHLKDIGAEFAAELSRLQARLDDAEYVYGLATDRAKAAEASLTALREDYRELQKLAQEQGVSDGNALTAATEDNKRLREALTPSGATKAAYIGEFKFSIEDRDEDGEECQREVTVPWTTTKEIMKAIASFAALTFGDPVNE